MENFEKCTVAMLGGPCSQHVTGSMSRLNQPQSAIMHAPWHTPLINPITLIQPVSCAPMASHLESIPSIPSPVPASATHRHKSNSLPCSSQCPESSWNNSHYPDPASVTCPHESIPSPVTCVPMAHPHKTISSPRSSRAPMTRPRKSIPSPWYSQCRTPPWHTS